MPEDFFNIHTSIKQALIYVIHIITPILDTANPKCFPNAKLLALVLVPHYPTTTFPRSRNSETS